MLPSNCAGAVICFAMFGTMSAAQSFGLEMATPLENLPVLKDAGSGKYYVDPPNPHPEFEAYIALVVPETGLCKVAAVGKDHKNDRFGTSVRTAYSTLMDALESRYGKHASVDFIKNGALWDGSNEWVMSIRQNERYLSSYWDDEENSDMPEDVANIALEVRALSSDTAYVSLSYEFRNFAECTKLLQQDATSGL